jgi:ZipA-like protein with FtsZ-binding domain
MTDLQLGLLVVGAAVVAAVLAYNRVQERKVQREAQRAFASQHSDTLLDEERRPERPLPRPERRIEAPDSALPDPRIDYVMELDIARGTLSATVLEHWRGVEHRFGRRVLLAGGDGDGWRRVVAGDVRSLTALRAALQVVSRSGVVGEPELVEFRAAVETMGAALGAHLSAPEMREALDQARELDAFCSDNDIQVALHITGGSGQARPDPGEFSVEPRADGVSLILDMPRTPQPARAFEAMARSARHAADASGGRMVDDNGNLLDERALRAIEVELEAVSARLGAAGIEPGGELALRLFS